MVKHIILWQLNPELTEEEMLTVKTGIKVRPYTVQRSCLDFVI